MDIADRASEEIRKGKRFAVVADIENADLIFTFELLITGTRERTRVTANSTSTGNSDSGSATATTVTSQDGSTRLRISTPDGRSIYVDTKPWSSGLLRRPASTNLVRDLHKRIEKAAKSP